MRIFFIKLNTNQMKLKNLFIAGLLLATTQLLIQSCVDKDPILSEKGEIESIIAEMTLDEKVNMIVGDGKFLPTVDPSTIETGTGIIINNQNSKLVIPRLGVRTSALTDGPAGVNRNPFPEEATEYTYTTVFPTGTCLAATWNTDLMEKVGVAFGNEVLEYDYDVILAPGLNLHRDPKCGRNFEYYSEDPLLSGKLSAAIVNGLQSNGIAATLKHFLANNQETNRKTYNAVIGQRTLREIYLRGFEIAVKESNPGAIMTAYNKLNGFYTPEIPDLLQDVVRDEWGFNGLYMTDFDMNHGDAVAQVRAGISMIMSGNKRELNEVKVAVENKTLDESILDKNLFYNMQLKLNSPREKGHIPSFKPDLEAHAKVAREALGEGIVLLKNDDNTLPLTTSTSIAVLGKTSYHINVHGTGSGGVRSIKYAISVYDGLKSAGFNVLKEVEQNYIDFVEKTKRENLVPPYFDNPKMRKANGIKGNQAPPHFKSRLVAFSKEQALSKSRIRQFETNSDVAIITLGRSGGENYENGLIPIRQLEIDLIKDVCATYHAANKKVVVILNVGGVWDTSNWKEYPDAILMAWHPGQEGGHGIADILSGVVNPSGKLPDSFPMKYEDVPSSSSFPGLPVEDPINSFYEEGIYVGYRYYDTFNVPTSYEFGFGMSYTSFEYTDLKLSSDTFSSKIKVTVTIKNTGKVAGKEIVQLYLSAPTTVLEKPAQELKGFGKTQLLKPGESEELTFELDERSLASFWSGISSWVADKGIYEVRIGASSKDIRLKTTFNLSEEIVVEKVHDILYPNFMLKELSQSK